MSALLVLGVAAAIATVSAFDNTCNNNVVSYWGQNSYGATHSDTANWQQRLSYYCNDNAVDVIPIAFVDIFSSTGGLPHLDVSNICNTQLNSVFPGTNLLDCSFLAADIKTCQAKGKIVTISLGGANGGGTAGTAFADQIWNLFLGGSSSTRPFGDAVLDGVDLDIESGANSYADFVNGLRAHYSGAPKKYYMSAAPQCPYPDAALGSTLNNAQFDMVYVQFYNNACGLPNYNSNAWNFGVWDYWARNVSPNKNVKIFLGAPASSTAAGSGYQPIGTLQSIATTMRSNFPSFGGVMYWDESQAYANGRYDVATKNFLNSGGSCGNQFTYSACSAPAWSASGNYPAGSQVTYQGYIWNARWYGSGPPTPDDTGSWVPVKACGGTSPPPPTTTTTKPVSTTSTKPVSTTTTKPVSTTTTKPVSTTTTSAPPNTTTAPSSGSCSGVATWSATMTYATAGTAVTYNGHLWTNSWWTYADVPGGAAGVWVDKGTCTSSRAMAEREEKRLRFDRR